MKKLFATLEENNARLQDTNLQSEMLRIQNAQNERSNALIRQNELLAKHREQNNTKKQKKKRSKYVTYEVMRQQIEQSENVIPDTNIQSNTNNNETAEGEHDEFQDADETQIFNSYFPVKLMEGNPHPDPLVQSASMSAVEPPNITYKHHLPPTVNINIFFFQINSTGWTILTPKR